jgi:tetratricopeptide (TPR) repeat protein
MPKARLHTHGNRRAPLLAALLLGLALPLAAADCSDDPAVQAMEKAVKADSHNATNSYNLAGAYFNKQCYDQAIGAFENTIKLARGDGDGEKDMRFECYSALGEVYFQVRADYPSAEKNFKLALELRPQDKDSLNGMSLVEDKLGKSAEAAKYLDATIALDPTDIKARFRRAKLLNDELEKMKKPDAEARRKVIKAFADVAALAEKQDAQAGKSDQDTLKANQPILLICYGRLGELYRDTDQPDKAIACLKQAVELAPDDINSRVILGNLYFKRQDYADMVEQLEKAVATDPKQETVRFNLGVAYTKQERFYDAWQQFKAVTDLDPGNGEALTIMGQTLESAVDQQLSQGTAHYTADELADAKVSFGNVLAMDPKNKTAQTFLAKVNAQLEKNFQDLIAKAKDYLKHKKQEDAAETLERALTLKPDDPEAKDLRGKTNANIGKLVARYIAAGDKANARKDYDAAEAAWTRAAAFSEGKKKAGARLDRLHKLTGAELAKDLKAAKAALKRKDLLAARADYRQAQTVTKDNPDITNGLSVVNTMIAEKLKKLVEGGKSAYASGAKDKAKKDFNDALRLDPNNADADSYIKKMTGSESNVKANADKAKALYYQGVDQYVNNHIKEAVVTWKEALKIDPNYDDAQKGLARAEAKLKALANL